MELSYLQQSDEKALQEFREKAWPQADREHYGEKFPNFDKKKEYLLAKEAGRIIGYISYTIQAGVGQVGSLIVDQDFRGQGIAKKLLEETEVRLKENHVHKVWLETGEDWGARTLYEKVGYEVRTILPNHFGHKNFILMDKII